MPTALSRRNFIKAGTAGAVLLHGNKGWAGENDMSGFEMPLESVPH